MILGAIGELQLWISASQINDVFYVISEGGKPHLGSASQERLRQCRTFIHLCALTEQDIDAALDLGWDDLEDAYVFTCAKKLNTSLIITRDQGFPASDIQTLSPSAYFNHIYQTQKVTYQEMTLGLDGVEDESALTQPTSAQ